MSQNKRSCDSFDNNSDCEFEADEMTTARTTWNDIEEELIAIIEMCSDQPNSQSNVDSLSGRNSILNLSSDMGKEIGVFVKNEISIDQTVVKKEEEHKQQKLNVTEKKESKKLIMALDTNKNFVAINEDIFNQNEQVPSKKKHEEEVQPINLAFEIDSQNVNENIEDLDHENVREIKVEDLKPNTKEKEEDDIQVPQIRNEEKNQEKQDPIKCSNPELETNYNSLQAEHRKILRELKEYKIQWSIVQPQYEYLHSEFKHFIQTKQDYMDLSNMKFLCITSDASVQTTESIICKNCIKMLRICQSTTFKEYHKLQNSGAYILTKNDYDELMANFRNLKKTITECESNNYLGTHCSQIEVIQLKHVNSKLKASVNDLLCQNKTYESGVKALEMIIWKLASEKNLTAGENFCIAEIVNSMENIQDSSEIMDSSRHETGRETGKK